MANRLKEKYLNEVVPCFDRTIQLFISDGCAKVDKIVLNMGVGEAYQTLKVLKSC